MSLIIVVKLYILETVMTSNLRKDTKPDFPVAVVLEYESERIQRSEHCRRC